MLIERTSIPDAEDSSNFQDYVLNGTSLMINKTAYVNSLSMYDIDASKHFNFDCPLTLFTILSVWDTLAGKELQPNEYSNLFDLNAATGLLTLKKFNLAMDYFI